MRSGLTGNTRAPRAYRAVSASNASTFSAMLDSAVSGGVSSMAQHRGFRDSVDFWRYNYTDLIAPAIAAQAIVTNDCADDGIPNDPRIIRGASGILDQINTSIVNIGPMIAAGLDHEIGYTADLGRAGGVDLYLQGTYIDRFAVDDGDGNIFDGVGGRNFTNNFAPLPRFRFNAGANWSRGIHNASVIVRHTDGYRNDQSNDAPIDSFTAVDVQYSISFDGLFGETVTSLVIGADNVLKQGPPRSTGSRGRSRWSN